MTARYSKARAVPGSVEFRMIKNLRPVLVATIHWTSSGSNEVGAGGVHFKDVARIWLNPLKRTYFCQELFPGREFMQLYELQVAAKAVLDKEEEEHGGV